MPDVRQERTGWRDAELSQRHRLWGWDCPMQDVDFLVVEYDSLRAIALIEYKHERSGCLCLSDAQYHVLTDLGDRAGLPIFIVRYASDFVKWSVIPLNELAREWLPIEVEKSECEYVEFLYRLRGREMPQDVGKSLHSWDEL